MLVPGWSDIEHEWQSDFVVPRDLLPKEDDWHLFGRELPKDKTVGAAGATPWVANVAPGWKGFVEIGGERMEFDDAVAKGRATRTPEGGYQVTMAPDVRLMFEAGNSVFFAQMTAPVRKLVPRSGDDVDWGFTAMMAFGVFIFVTVALLMYLSPPTARTRATRFPDRFVDLLLEKPEPEKKDKKAATPTRVKAPRPRRKRARSARRKPRSTRRRAPRSRSRSSSSTARSRRTRASSAPCRTAT
jgi:hypothetical protein